jgi:hypothetical protein
LNQISPFTSTRQEITLTSEPEVLKDVFER